MLKRSLTVGLCAVAALVGAETAGAKEYHWKKGVVEEQFVYTKAPFAECHSASIAETPEGLVCTFFGGTKERHPDVCIYVSRKPKGSDEWTAPEKVADGVLANDPGQWSQADIEACAESAKKYGVSTQTQGALDPQKVSWPCWNPVLYQVPGGELLLFYKMGPSPSQWLGRLKRSTDNGHSWSAAEALPDGIIGPVKNKPVEIDGQLVCPSSQEGNGWRLFLDVTPDGGKTWSQIGPLNEKEPWLAIQPSILFHKNGDLQMLFRTRNRRVGTAWSHDRGLTWSPIDSTLLPQNNSGTDAVTLRDGRQLIVYNHVLDRNGQAKGPRTPLNVSLSKDGKKWYASLVLEDSPISQYSYPAVIQTSDGYVHFVYTWRRQRIKYVKVDPKKLQMVEIKEDGLWPGLQDAFGPEKAGETPYPVSACDWMLLKRQKDGAITLAREIGCDGLEVDMNSLSKNPTFQSRFKNNPEELQKYKTLAALTGIKISSVAMSGFYAQSFASRESYIEPVADCIDVMKGLGVKVCFLPLGVTSDLKKNPELRPQTVARLKEVGRMAEEAGVVIGIETTLDAADEKALLREVGSPAVKSYFNFQNPLANGRDLYEELRILGDDICMIHCTNTDKYWLENDPQIDMPAIKKTLEEIGYDGWLVIERSRDASDSRNVRRNYGANCAYLKSVFQAE